jgi:hypothetical protein
MLEGILTVVCPGVVCLLIGLVVYGVPAFYWRTPSFQFIMTGFLVGALVLIAQRLSLVQFVGAVVLITVAMIMGTGSSSLRLIPRVVVLMSVLACAVLVNVKVLPRVPQVCVIGKYVVWTVVFILAHFLVGVILLIIFRPENVTPHLLVYAKLAVLTGIGLGIGFKAQQWLVFMLNKGTSRGSVASDGGRGRGHVTL